LDRQSRELLQDQLSIDVRKILLRSLCEAQKPLPGPAVIPVEGKPAALPGAIDTWICRIMRR